MTAHITYRQATQVAPGSTTTKNAQLTNAEIDGNIKSLVVEIDTKAPLNSPVFTGTVSGITKSMVGLGSVDNTSDNNKPISAATQTALNTKQATLVSGTNIKTVGGQSLVGSGEIGQPTFTTPVVAYSFTPSSSTVPVVGMFLPAANILAFSTASVEGLRVGADQTITAGGPATSPAFKIVPIASQVNYISVLSSVTGNSPIVSVAGTDTNTNLSFRAKGTGAINFQTGSTPANQFQISDTAGATRVIVATGSVAGNPSLNTSAGDLSIAAPLLTSKGLFNSKIAMAANDIDLRQGSVFTKTISGATSFTVSNVPGSGTVGSFVLDLTNGGSAVITWMTGTKWGSGSAPSLTAAGRDILSFYTHDGGTTWNGIVLAKALA